MNACAAGTELICTGALQLTPPSIERDSETPVAPLAKVLAEVRNDVEAGQALSTAML